MLSSSPLPDLYRPSSEGLFFLIAIMNTSVQSETELSSVNSILMAIGQAPINRIYQNTKQEPAPVQQIVVNKINDPATVETVGKHLEVRLLNQMVLLLKD